MAEDLEDQLNAAVLRVVAAADTAKPGHAFAALKDRLAATCPPELQETAAVLVLAASRAVRTDEAHEQREHDRRMTGIDLKYRLIAGAIGIVGLIGMVWLAIAMPDPTPSQLSTFRLVRALCGGAVVGALAGTLKVAGTVKWLTIQATSAVAAVVIFYFFS